jgi:dephospho-CoA kinase
MGKSTAQTLLIERGVRVLDTDQIARDLVEPGQPALVEIRAGFGSAVFHPDGTLHRDALARVVFSDPEGRRQLESILHPRIRQRWLAEVEKWRAQGVRLGAVVIPLLFETNAASSFDAVVCVACSAAAQQARLAARGWSAPEIQQRIAAQWPVEKKIAASDFIVWTDGDLEAHARQWDRILRVFPA